MQQYIADDTVILNLSGLRYIQKRDSGSIYEHYYLDWEYKGSKGTAGYKNIEDRDAMYTRVREALIKNAEIKPQN